jgi:hypothetical protein
VLFRWQKDVETCRVFIQSLRRPSALIPECNKVCTENPIRVFIYIYIYIYIYISFDALLVIRCEALETFYALKDGEMEIKKQ